MNNVFTIVDEYENLLKEVEDLGGELTPELEEQLVIKEQEIAKKVRAYYYVIQTMNSQIDLVKQEVERLEGVKKVKENVIKRIKKYVNLAVETFGTIKPSGVKGLDLGDLKVWQKKTEKLDVIGEINDERFCDKIYTVTCNYQQAEEFKKIIANDILNGINIVENVKVKNDKLKDWLIENEESNKQLLNKIREHTPLNPVPIQLSKEERDNLNIIENSKLLHNSTVTFK